MVQFLYPAFIHVTLHLLVVACGCENGEYGVEILD